MKSRTTPAEAAVARTLGECPNAKWGVLNAALHHRREWRTAHLYREKGDLGSAGVRYAEAGMESAALRMVKKLLATPEGAGAESNLLGAARIIIALHRATGSHEWAMCAKRMAGKAQEAGKLEDAALIFEEAGFQDDAFDARRQLRLSRWADSVGAVAGQARK